MNIDGARILITGAAGALGTAFSLDLASGVRKSWLAMFAFML
jgi:nucleoside-diphosphate-sugar epimerase